MPKALKSTRILCSTEGGPLGKIQVNFDPGLVAMLRETRYFQLVTGGLPSTIPDLALKVGGHSNQLVLEPLQIVLEPFGDPVASLPLDVSGGTCS